MDDAASDTYTVAGLSAAIGRAVSQAFPAQVWVRGEIRDLQRPNSGHVFFSLVDPDDERVRLPVALFLTEKYLVNRILTRSGAVRMTDGVEVRIRGDVTHYPMRGTVQMRMTMIDPDYTVGKLAAERARVLRALEKDGLLERNAGLPSPLVPLRIGLVTSRGSAAEADFVSTIDASPYRFQVTLVDARVQGVDAVATLLAALDRLDGAVDVVAMVRGGGSATDLAAFDDERLARRIAAMRTPVFTGVGHEIDRSVADEVAASPHKTPTEAAVAIVSIVVRFEERLGALRRGIASSARRRMAGEHSSLVARRQRLVRSARGIASAETTRLEAAGRRVAIGSRRILEGARRALGDRTNRLLRMAPLAVERATRDLGARRERIVAADPERLLARGWSITLGPDGTVLRDLSATTVGEVVRTRLAGGELASEVTDVTVFGEDGGDPVTE